MGEVPKPKWVQAITSDFIAGPSGSTSSISSLATPPTTFSPMVSLVDLNRLLSLLWLVLMHAIHASSLGTDPYTDNVSLILEFPPI